MPSEDEVDGGSNAAENDQSTTTESKDAAPKPTKVIEKEKFPNGKSLTEDSDSAVAETNVIESNVPIDSVVLSKPVEETQGSVESIYITETKDQTDDINSIQLVTPAATSDTVVDVTPDTEVAITLETEVTVTLDSEVAVTLDTEADVTQDTEVAMTLDTEVAVTPDTEVAVTPDTEVAVTLDTEVAVTLETEAAVTPDTEVTVTLETEVAVTPDTEVAVTPDTEVAVTPDTEVAVTPNTEVCVTPEITEPTLVKSDSLELLTSSKSAVETEPIDLETEAEITLVTEAESGGMEGSEADEELDIQDSFMETKDGIVDDLEFIRGKLATPPTLMEDVMKHQELHEDTSNNLASSNPAIDTDSCGNHGQNVREWRAPLQRVFDYLCQCLLPSSLNLLQATASFIFSFSEALASLLDTFFTRAMPKVKAD